MQKCVMYFDKENRHKDIGVDITKMYCELCYKKCNNVKLGIFISTKATQQFVEQKFIVFCDTMCILGYKLLQDLKKEVI